MSSKLRINLYYKETDAAKFVMNRCKIRNAFVCIILIFFVVRHAPEFNYTRLWIKRIKYFNRSETYKPRPSTSVAIETKLSDTRSQANNNNWHIQQNSSGKLEQYTCIPRAIRRYIFDISSSSPRITRVLLGCNQEVMPNVLTINEENQETVPTVNDTGTLTGNKRTGEAEGEHYKTQNRTTKLTTYHNCDSFNRTRYFQCPYPTGRLGNWIFHFAVCLGMARTLNYKAVIEASHPLTKYFVEIDNTFASEINLTNMVTVRDGDWENPTMWDKSEYCYHNLTFKGVFHSCEYFSNISKELRKALAIKPVFVQKAYAFIEATVPKVKTKIGVHVRRGDFFTPKEQQYGRTLADKHYLAKAMTFYRLRFTNAHFVVCSDDMEWTKGNIQAKESEITWSNFTEDIMDMAILSLCDHTIITCGTFGWWGGWLAGGTVVYLKDYPRPGSRLAELEPHKDYYPSEWIGMSNGESK